MSHGGEHGTSYAGRFSRFFFLLEVCHEHRGHTSEEATNFPPWNRESAKDALTIPEGVPGACFRVNLNTASGHVYTCVVTMCLPAV